MDHLIDESHSRSIDSIDMPVTYGFVTHVAWCILCPVVHLLFVSR